MAAKRNTPPPLSLRLIRYLCREELHEELEGNLHEFYITHNNTFSKLSYWYEVIKYLRPSTLRSFTQNRKGSMFIFNPLLTVRNLARQGSSTLINLSGFTMSLVCVFFLYFYIRSEIDTDKFHKDGDQIYRAIRVSQINGNPYNIGITSGPFAKALALDFPGSIQETCRAMPDDILLSYGEKKFIEKEMVFADANFFTFFSFPLQEGLPGEVLRQPNAIVLSTETAKKYFGDKNPIGETMLISNEHSLVVTGLFPEQPENSHLKFDAVVAIDFYANREWFNGWWNNGLFTYIKAETPEIASHVSSQLPQFMDKYFGEDFKESGDRIDLALEPLTDIYFNNETRYDPAQHGDIKTVLILAMVGAGILFIACFNYVNLSIAQSFRRAREIGIRKVLGGDKGRLMLQFVGESFFITLFSILLALFISVLTRPWLNGLFGFDVRFDWTDPQVYLFLGGVVLTIVLLSGVYPAILLSSFRPVNVLKGMKMRKGGTPVLRKGLVIAQFVISICMISLTLLVYRQISFMSEKELGFNKEAILLLANTLGPNNDAFVKELEGHSSIGPISFSSGEPGNFHDATTLKVEGLNGNFRMRTVAADENYLKVFDIKLVAGRDFSESFQSEEEKGIIINEKGLEELGLKPEEAIGRLVTLPGWDNLKRRIIGIAANYHFSSLREPIEPLALISATANWRIAVKIKSDIREGMDAVFDTFERLSPGYPVIFSFLDDDLERLYAKEQQQRTVFTSFALVSIFLACLGILGLASYTAQQRQKEFGIRKVLGASGAGILQLISKEYILLIIAAFAIAAPLSWYFIDGWLDGFAYRIDLSRNLHLFLLSGVVTGVVAIASITLKTYKAAVSNPIESIRYE